MPLPLLHVVGGGRLTATVSWRRTVVLPSTGGWLNGQRALSSLCGAAGPKPLAPLGAPGGRVGRGSLDIDKEREELRRWVRTAQQPRTTRRGTGAVGLVNCCCGCTMRGASLMKDTRLTCRLGLLSGDSLGTSMEAEVSDADEPFPLSASAGSGKLHAYLSTCPLRSAPLHAPLPRRHGHHMMTCTVQR